MVALKGVAVLALAACAAASQRVRKLGVKKTIQPGDLDVNPQLLYPKYNISVPVDHFHNESKYAPHSNDFFNLSYFYDAQYYKPGGPVIVLASGEDSAEDRLPYLQKGILHQLAQATNGIGVVLQHRYYGSSFPVPDLSTENLRFLSTEQALADYAYFAQHIRFDGIDYDTTAANTPFIAYGGSYAGGFVAFLRTLYPGLYWGAISASGVTEAINDYWQYYDPVTHFGPQQCMQNLQHLTNMVDNIFAKNQAYNHTLRQAFGLDNITSNADFTNVLSGPLGYWQERNWDPAINSPVFLQWCGNLTASKPLYSPSKNLTTTAQELLKAGGYGNQVDTLTTPLLNWIGYVNKFYASQCPESSGNQDECFEQNNPASYSAYDLSQWTWRSWTYQVCTQWGYFITGSGVPQNQLPLVSRLQDLAYESAECELAFGLKSLPDNNAINRYGGFNIAYSRLMLVGGHADPWRDATPLSEYQPQRNSTPDEPVVLITTPDYGAVHHWDENGVFANQTTQDFPPRAIQDAQQTERDTAVRWVAEFQACRHNVRC